VIAERDRVNATREQLVGELGRNPDSVRHVLAVRHAEVDVQLFPQRRQTLLERLASRCADDIGQKEDPQLAS